MILEWDPEQELSHVVLTLLSLRAIYQEASIHRVSILCRIAYLQQHQQEPPGKIH